MIDDRPRTLPLDMTAAEEHFHALLLAQRLSLVPYVHTREAQLVYYEALKWHAGLVPSDGDKD